MSTQVIDEPRDTVTCAVAPQAAIELADDASMTGVIELLLKGQDRLDSLARDERRQADLIPRYLAIVLTSFSVYALALVLLLDAAPPQARPELLRERWASAGPAPAISLWAAYTLGMIASSGVCLPSFYFFGLLSGVRVSLVQVVGHIMKGKASTAMMLLGLLPIYVALMLGSIVLAAPPDRIETLLLLGLLLPFGAGMWGVVSIYSGFQGHCDTLPEARRARRACFLRRLTFAWAALYTIVTPVMIFTIWDSLSRTLLNLPAW
ncbi:MAG: hypothetical protein AB7K24_14590 [Gemmataceae bacterium]